MEKNKKTKKAKYNKYDILEIIWLDSYYWNGSWKTPSEIKEWMNRPFTDYTNNTIGYYLDEDNDFIKVFQSYDNKPNDERNKQAFLGIAKSCIKSIKVIKKKKNKERLKIKNKYGQLKKKRK